MTRELVVENVSIPNLEKSDLLRMSLPPLARKLGVSKKRAWQILEEYKGMLSQKIDTSEEPSTRREVNLFWQRYRSNLPNIGLSCLSRIKGPSSLPYTTYHQLICLATLEKIFSDEGLKIAKEARCREEEKRQAQALAQQKISLWQRFVGFLKRHLRR